MLIRWSHYSRTINYKLSTFFPTQKYFLDSFSSLCYADIVWFWNNHWKSQRVPFQASLVLLLLKADRKSDCRRWSLSLSGRQCATRAEGTITMAARETLMTPPRPSTALKYHLAEMATGKNKDCKTISKKKRRGGQKRKERAESDLPLKRNSMFHITGQNTPLV